MVGVSGDTRPVQNAQLVSVACHVPDISKDSLLLDGRAAQGRVRRSPNCRQESLLLVSHFLAGPRTARPRTVRLPCREFLPRNSAKTCLGSRACPLPHPLVDERSWCDASGAHAPATPD